MTTTTIYLTEFVTKAGQRYEWDVDKQLICSNKETAIETAERIVKNPNLKNMYIKAVVNEITVFDCSSVSKVIYEVNN